MRGGQNGAKRQRNRLFFLGRAKQEGGWSPQFQLGKKWNPQNCHIYTLFKIHIPIKTSINGAKRL